MNLKLNEFGFYMHWLRSTRMSTSIWNPSVTDFHESNDGFSQLVMKNVLGIFILLVFFLFISFVIFVCELILGKINKNK